MRGIDFSGYESPFTWNNGSPRLGATWALDDARQTLLRASASRYAGQLATGNIVRVRNADAAKCRA